MPTSVVFVCWGNIMRSAFAEAWFAREVRRLGLEEQVSFSSAGVRASPGHPAEPNALKMASQLGVSLGNHRATRMSADLVNAADHILIMDRLNHRLLLQDFPDARDKVRFLSTLIPGAPLEIADPYMEGDLTLERCFTTVARAVTQFAEDLAAEQAPAPRRPERS